MLNRLNNYGDGVDESIGDIALEKIDDKAEEEAKKLGKKGLKKTGKVLDKVTDKIKPIKAIKDKVKGAKSAVSQVKKKVKDFSKQGLKHLGKAAVKGGKAAVGFLASHPVITAIGVVVIVLIVSVSKGDADSDDGNYESNDVLIDNPAYADIDGMSDNENVVVLMDDCTTDEYTSFSNDQLATTEKDTMALKIYSAFKNFGGGDGFNNASLAGLLANLDCESGYDPTRIEGISAEYGIMGEKKAKAVQSIDNYTQNTLFPMYEKQKISYVRSAYLTQDAHGNDVYYCGVGLAQWTGGNAKQLFTAANTIHSNWYDMTFQLAYLYTDSLYRPNFFTNWVADQYEGLTDDDYDDWLADYTAGMDSYDDAEIQAAWDTAVYESWVEAARLSAVKVVDEFEGIDKDNEDNADTIAKRQDVAEECYQKIMNWADTNVDTTLQNSVVSLASQLGAVAEWNEVADKYYRCTNNTIYDNSSLATAAISYAWPTKRDSEDNNGTPLYQTVHDAICGKTDPYYMSCDRTVGCAVRWSGTDDTYSYSGTTHGQLPYLTTSSRWELVGMADAVSIDDLQPGDVFIAPSPGVDSNGKELAGHTFLYVGQEAIQAIYGSTATPGSDSVEGSLGSRSPGCTTETQSILNNGGTDTIKGVKRGPYYVFRCVDPQHSTTYTNIASNITTTNN